MMTRFPLLDEGACQRITDRLEAMRGQWFTRQPGFATVGAAAYLDVCCSSDPAATYYGRLAESNALLEGAFAAELEIVRRAMENVLGAPARFERTVALPGFHVFEEFGITTTERPSAHFDHQHRYIQWPFNVASNQVLSFTLAVKLPKMGGGLDVWDVTEEELDRLGKMGRSPNVEKLARLKPSRRHEYEVGHLSVQLRALLHRISAVPKRFPGDQRITMQGHGVRCGDTWVLYW